MTNNLKNIGLFLEYSRDWCGGLGACSRTQQFLCFILHRKLHLQTRSPTQREVEDMLVVNNYDIYGHLESSISDPNLPWKKHFIPLNLPSPSCSSQHVLLRIRNVLSEYGYVGVSLGQKDDDDWKRPNHAFVIYREHSNGIDYQIDDYIGCSKKRECIRVLDWELFESLLLDRSNTMKQWNLFFDVDVSNMKPIDRWDIELNL